MKTKQSSASPRPVSASRDALLAAGTELFAQYGFDGVSVEQMARRARVNRAMVSYHFGGKKKLYVAILRQGLERLEQRLAPIRSSSAAAPRRLEAFVAAFAEVATEHASFPRLMLREVLAGGDQLEAHLLGHFVGMFGLVREIVQQGVQQRSLRRVDPILTHLGLIGSLVFYFATAPTRNRLISEGKLGLKKEPPISEYVRHIQEWIALGLSVPAPSPTPRRKHGFKSRRSS
jgi:TetR/AcrR family transcriptional regulator